MNNQHPITPTAELVNQWFDDTAADSVDLMSFAITAAQWGADQELEACCEALNDDRDALQLREDRRGEPTSLRRKEVSLKEQALESLKAICAAGDALDPTDLFTLRDALEALPND